MERITTYFGGDRRCAAPEAVAYDLADDLAYDLADEVVGGPAGTPASGTPA